MTDEEIVQHWNNVTEIMWNVMAQYFQDHDIRLHQSQPICYNAILNLIFYLLTNCYREKNKETFMRQLEQVHKDLLEQFDGLTL
mgnify:CR=1 FL=1